ncbi:MAG: discoidin domain-containing protein [Clostridiaceae bacterium]|nr:discoidin domain-containing protein [Clostridiaceae bacterium]
MKKAVCLICVIAMLFSMIPANTLAATVLNEDVSIETPVNGSMETSVEASAVSSQLLGAESKAELSEDCKEGEFALKVTTKDEPGNAYAAYTLVNSDTFFISSFSSIDLWVKPGIGANWVEFYTNEALILGDENGDGRYEVGTDLTIGIWNKITLNLLNTQTTVTEGKDLAIHTDENSVWLYDGVTSKGTEASSIDLSAMVNHDTQMNNNCLEYPKTADGTAYVTAPTVLVSGDRVAYEKTFTTQADFSGGTPGAGVTVDADGKITFSYVDACSGGTAISDSGTASYLFDNNTNSNWISSAGIYTSGNAYVGYDFGKDMTVSGFSISQCTNCGPTVTSIKMQYYDGNTWKTVGTYSLPASSAKQIVFTDLSATGQKWRLLANANLLTSSGSWSVYEVEFFGSVREYTSSVIDISTATKVDYGEIFWNGSDDAKFSVETSLSLNGGTTWGNWQPLNANGTISGIDGMTNLQSARLKFKVSVKEAKVGAVPVLNDLTIRLVRKSSGISELPGKLSAISISSQNKSIAGTKLTAYDKVNYTFLNDMASYALSGDGKTLYYIQSSRYTDTNKKVYKLDLRSGNNTLIYTSTHAGTFSELNVQTNYDGTKAVIHMRCDSDRSYAESIKYDVNLTNSVTTSGSCSNYKMLNDGSIAYHYSSNQLYYEDNYGKTLSCYYGGSSYNFAPYIKNNQFYFYGYDSDNHIYGINCASIGTSALSYVTILSKSTEISGLQVSQDGNTLYYYFNSNVYAYNLTTKTERKLNVTASSIYSIIEGDRLILRDSSNDYFIYDPEMDTRISIRPSDFSGMLAIDYSGNELFYIPSDQTVPRMWYRDGATDLNRYLLSFDGKNKWYSYKSGSWVMVQADVKPSEATLTQYGMTAEEVNALTAADFAPLYEGGKEIYTVDVAAYYASISPYITPSVSSINVITDRQEYGSAGTSTANPIYAAKSVAFAGSGWDKVNRLYPIEITSREASFTYFIYSNGKYQYYSGSQWVVENGTEIADLIADTETNWIKLKQLGMTAAEVRAIPASALTSQLAGSDFSVVYCMQVSDTSTAGYYSKISADYSKNLIASTNLLTIHIVFIDGTDRAFSGFTDSQAEDFMDWLDSCKNGRGASFYRLTNDSGTTQYVSYSNVEYIYWSES